MRIPIAFALCLVLCAMPCAAAPQSLGDAARRQAKSREAGAPAKVEAKIYSDGDLTPARAGDADDERSGEERSGGESPSRADATEAEPPAGRSKDEWESDDRSRGVPLPEGVTPPELFGYGTPHEPPGSADEELRRQLDREERLRKAWEESWSRRLRQAALRIAGAQREYDAACGRHAAGGG